HSTSTGAGKYDWGGRSYASPRDRGEPELAGLRLFQLLGSGLCADDVPEELVQRRLVLDPAHDDDKIVVPVDVDDVHAVADEAHRRRGRFGEGLAVGFEIPVGEHSPL